MSDCVFVPDWPDLPSHVKALSTLRCGGVSAAPYDDGKGRGGFNLAAHVGDQIESVLQNRAILAGYLPRNLTGEPQWLSQVHGTEVLELGAAQHNEQRKLIADACCTSVVNTVCAVQTADCLPVLFCDPTSNHVAAAHAGWRGLVNGVIENTLAKMVGAGANLDRITVWLGPAIGPHQFEVGAEVRQLFVDADPCARAAFVAREYQEKAPQDVINAKFYADIYQLARLRLQRAGVQRISGGNFCTVSEPEKFYSYRRDGITGRMASLIWISAAG